VTTWKRSGSQWRQPWILYAVVAIYVAARLWHLAAVCLDGDEIFGVLLSRLGWKALTAAAAVDTVHPPVFYYLLKVWILIGNESLLWLRLLPALFSVLSILPLILLGRELRLRPVEIYCVIGLAGVHPLLIYYSQHLRMYSLLMLCSLTSMWLFHRAIRTRGLGYAALTVANIVLVYSHYFGWIVVGLECLYMIVWRRERWKPALSSAAVVFAAFTPWLYVAGTHAFAKGGLNSNLDWIAKPTSRDLVLFFVDMAGFGDFPNAGQCALVVLALPIVAAVWVAWRRRHTRSLGHALHFLLFFTLCPVAISFAASRILPNSVWGRRHLIFVAATLLLTTSVAYWRLRSPTVRLVGALACAAWAFAVVSHHLKRDDRRLPFDTFVVQMLAQEKEQPGPIPFFAVDKTLHYPVSFYLKTLEAKKTTGFTLRFTAPELDRLSKKAAAFEVHRDATVDEARGTHFWLGTTTYAWTQEVTPQEIMIQRGCRVGPELRVVDRYHTAMAFPVWCDPGR
jgi:hypothetical protein